MASARERIVRRWLVFVSLGALLASGMLYGGCPSQGDDDDDDDAASYDLVITEVMADPDATPDAVGEWVEICTTGDALEIPSSAIQIAVGGGLAKSIASPDTLSFDPCLVFKEHAAGQSASLDDAVAVDGMQSIGNTSSSVCLTTTSGAEIDCVSTGEPTIGKSWSLCGDQIDADANDVSAHWFTDETNACCENADGDADFGTPGVWNGTPEACAGGDDDDDTTDDPVDIPYGTLVIAEVMGDPRASGDNAGEWFEVCAPSAPQVIDLADVNVVNDGVVKTIHEPAEVTFDPCLSFGKYREDPSETPTVLLGGVLVESLGSLPQDGGALCLRTVDGDDIDCVAYPAPTTGSSHALSWDALDADLNDETDAWCLDEINLYDGDDLDTGDTGTPGQPNAVCAD